MTVNYRTLGRVRPKAPCCNRRYEEGQEVTKVQVGKVTSTGGMEFEEDQVWHLNCLKPQSQEKHYCLPQNPVFHGVSY